MESTGVIVPLFAAYSRAQMVDVNEIIQTKTTHPSVPFLVVINPANGPGSPNDSSDYTPEVAEMQAVGISVLGYISTSWGTRASSAVEGDILTYHDSYHVNGIDLDEMPNWEYNSPNGTWYYSGPGGTYLPAYFANLTSYARSLGMTKMFANSGTDVPQNFIGAVDTIGIFENGYLPQMSNVDPSLAGPGAWHVGHNKSNFAFFSYDVSLIDPYYIVAASNYVSYMYITNMSGNQPYDELPPYFDELVSILASVVPVTIESATTSGAAASNPGLNVTETQPDSWSSSAVTPYTFDAYAGSTITISAQGDASSAFDAYAGSTITISAQGDASSVLDTWSNAATGTTVVLTPVQATTLIACVRG